MQLHKPECDLLATGSSFLAPATNQTQTVPPDRMNNLSSAMAYGSHPCKAGVLGNLRTSWKKITFMASSMPPSSRYSPIIIVCLPSRLHRYSLEMSRAWFCWHKGFVYHHAGYMRKCNISENIMLR
ncbi:hypothetical protein GUJ93_ZPchr0010g10636 [Zizania palustris]|uniref:Uncharacterized protein n=1 Tax=Zizania palustris TaxID=103762 RepID=A0A8J6BKP3_ZIZPA|nr:hypothetical protein GUJ93_ZPchr0010g10636 [Zizania palustris]